MRLLVHIKRTLIFGPVQNNLAWTKYIHGCFRTKFQVPAFLAVHKMSYRCFEQHQMSAHHINLYFSFRDNHDFYNNYFTMPRYNFFLKIFYGCYMQKNLKLFEKIMTICIYKCICKLYILI